MKIAIAGFGVEGRANYNYFSADNNNDITIVDERSSIEGLPTGAKAILGPNAFASLNNFDMVVRTAGLAPELVTTDGVLWSGTEEFFKQCPAPIIGVTGTKGKGTTASMIASIFEAAGRKVWLVGNIGVAALSVLPEIKPDDIVVYELSSFQLWNLSVSPQVAVVLNIEPEHLDKHKTYQNYLSAKANIRRHQVPDDVCIYYADSKEASEIARLSEGVALPYGSNAIEGAHVRDDFFYVKDRKICATSEVGLRGEHNIENAIAAVAVAHYFEIENDTIAVGIRNFRGLPHRLELVACIQGVSYYNDSFSSSTSATLAAVRSFVEPEILILGGVDRGGDFEHLAQFLSTRNNIKEVVLIGAIRHKLASLLKEAKASVPVVVLDAVTMRDVVRNVSSKAASGDVVLLSPGAASFDMFQDFYDRGDQFRREVQGLARKQDVFVFDSYSYDPETYEATFCYYFEHQGEKREEFTERVVFEAGDDYDGAVLDNALRLAFLVAGTSYYKAYPTRYARLPFTIDDQQARFLNNVYQEGLSQFAFENNLTRDDLVRFEGTGAPSSKAVKAASLSGTLALQSGGKDSLLVSCLLNAAEVSYAPWYIGGSSGKHPQILDELGQPLVTATRYIDLDSLKRESQKGAYNGHVPVTYIVQGYALIQAILLGKRRVLVSIAHEGEEPHATIGTLSVTHQWSKTWGAEQLFADFVHRYISPDIVIGSPLRQYSELKVAELFVQYSWDQFGYRFSSCNRANYRQAVDNSKLEWCGDCPKCANAYLLFAPFVPAQELQRLFGGNDLFTKESLEETFKGLLGIDDTMKPFECVGEVEELRYAYHQALMRDGYAALPFQVPVSSFDYRVEYPSQQLLSNEEELA